MEKSFTHTFERGGVTLTASISPCVWMYPTYPLQIAVTFQGGGNVFVVDKAVQWNTATEADVIRLAHTVGIIACKQCQKPAFDPATVETNRGGLCEHCFAAILMAEYHVELEKEQKKIKRRDARMVKQGFAYRVSAWIHPSAGSDYQVDLYFRDKPTSAVIEAQIVKEGSTVKDDYQAPIKL